MEIENRGMMVRCAYCGKVIKEGSKKKISDGACRSCYDKEMEKIDRLEEEAKRKEGSYVHNKESYPEV